MNTHIHPDAIQAVIAGNHGAPFDLLGAHQIDEQHVSIRAFYPYAEKLQLVIDGKRTPMNRLRDEGFFEAAVEAQRESLRYQYEIQTYEGQSLAGSCYKRMKEQDLICWRLIIMIR